MCAECWSNLESFHNFYLTVNRAKDKYLSNCMNIEPPSRDGEIVVENFTDEGEAEMFLCKDEPLEVIESDETLQPVDSAFEINLNCPFERENFAPEVTIDKRDFDAIFLEEFSTECEDRKEEVPTIDQYVEQLVSPDRIPVVQSQNKRSLQESRKRPAESPSKFSLIGEPEHHEDDKNNRNADMKVNVGHVERRKRIKRT